ncbi:hypothetical protein SUGI_1419690 [Cryptomeria japonica]|uniref:Berberine/berberine-like domain-containing protein n=1 Tax=Cryptomeria japonica TaxID=3369 RepID=A0AAD3RQV7_CRYJA|nr:hypothetical protein SUGI_0714220 [Cryptomeria japonica]GLJ35522.1 hypothetical protein SUGI_0714240 [Cryptomeria japonica]GLJ58100.1 hypothetical protein SUGI_1419640 [Cryptomeria japonica]GLJ58104.1 hypothetical protein SUGI_1419690 [Cryptomeria japonica]
MDEEALQIYGAVYVNYLDLDLDLRRVSVEEARAWSDKYFDHNNERLVKAKSLVDPQNFFKNYQSIPPLAN